MKCWACLIGWLNDIDVALKTISLTRRNVPFCRPLGDGYYVRVYNYTHCVDFCRFYVPHGYKANQIRPTTNGVVILSEEWNDLLQNVIPTLHKRYPEFTFWFARQYRLSYLYGSCSVCVCVSFVH